MPSKDFLKLMELIYDKKYKILGIRCSFNRKDGMEAEIELEKNADNIKIKSSEPDFVMYVTSINKIIDETGDFKMAKIKDTNKYYDDIDFLVDEKKEKIKNAIKRVSEGKFDFEGLNIEETLDRFLLRKRMPKDKEILKLKKWYYEIFAYYLLFSNQVNKYKDVTIDKGDRKTYYQIVDKLLSKGFLRIGNPIKDYLFFRKYSEIDISELLEKTKEESDFIRFIIQRMSIKPVKSKHSIKVVLEIYRRISELLKPLINLLRICVEVKNGNNQPKLFLNYVRNVQIISEDNNSAKLVEFIDPHIRNNESHLKTIIDNKNKKVKLKDKKGIIVKEYTFDEIIKITHFIERILLPSILFSFLIFNCAIRLLIFKDGKYKMALLSLGNT